MEIQPRIEPFPETEAGGSTEAGRRKLETMI